MNKLNKLTIPFLIFAAILVHETRAFEISAKCDDGYYLLGLSCTQCPAGYWCGGLLGVPKPCLSGTYSKAGSTECTPCPSGNYFCPDPSLLPVSEASDTDINRKDIVAFAQFSYMTYAIGTSNSSDTFLVADAPELNTLGVVTISDDKTTIIAGFRGTTFTATDSDVIHGANPVIDLVAVPVPYTSCYFCVVHLGFVAAYQSIADQMKANVKSLKTLFPGASKLVVTGHSLGGAIATLFAVDMATNEGANNLNLVTFGSPRVGNAVFADFANQQIKGNNWRVTYDNDVVTIVPLQLIIFKHVGTEVHYIPTDNGHYYKLPDFVDVRYVRASVSDHRSYLKMIA